jgi:hypothetical protein
MKKIEDRHTFYTLLTKNLLSLVIMLSVFLILFHSILKLLHLSSGFLTNLIPYVLILLVCLIAVKIFKLRFKNDSFLIFLIFLSILTGCEKKELVPKNDELQSFLNENNLKISNTRARSERRFNDFNTFKDYYTSRFKKNTDGDTTVNVVTSAKETMSNLRTDGTVPCLTNNYTYNTNGQIYNYDGDADLNINLTFGVNGSGGYINPTVNISQFGNTSDAFSATPATINANSQTGDITFFFNTTQTNTFNLGVTDYSNTTLTTFRVVYNPCGNGRGRMSVQHMKK